MMALVTPAGAPRVAEVTPRARGTARTGADDRAAAQVAPPAATRNQEVTGSTSNNGDWRLLKQKRIVQNSERVR